MSGIVKLDEKFCQSNFLKAVLIYLKCYAANSE